MKNLYILFFILLVVFQSLLAQTNFVKFADNPLIKPAPNTFYSRSVAPGEVIYHEGVFKMWFSGIPFGNVRWQTGYAESIDGLNWTVHPDTVLKLGSPESFDATMAVPHTVIFEDSVYKMWYWGMHPDEDGWYRSRIGYATSPDGINWTKYEGNPIIDVGPEDSWSNHGVWTPMVVKVDGIYHMWYSGRNFLIGGFRMGYATSTDGIYWTKYEGNPIIEHGPNGSWDDTSQWNPFVRFNGDYFEMWYGGATSAEEGPSSRIGYATSTDGIIWTKDSDNPVLEPGVAGTFEGAWVESARIIHDGNIIHMWYQGADSKVNGERKRAIGYAQDFSRIPHSDQLEFKNPTYLVPEKDTLFVSTKINNKNNHEISVYGFIESMDSTKTDTFILEEDDGDTWSGYWTVTGGEHIYRVGIVTTDLDSGTIHQGMMWNPAKFSTSGPLVLKNHEVRASSIPGVYYLVLDIANDGYTKTIKDISVEISTNDTLVTITNGKALYGNIAPGEVKEPGQYFIFHIDTSNVGPDKIDHIIFNLAIASNNNIYWYDQTSIPLNISGEFGNLAETYELSQNYPNPFNPKTIITYQLPMVNDVELSIYNTLGQKVTTLINEKQQPGRHKVEWDASGFASGVYYYKIEAGEFQEVKKMMLIK